MPGTGDAARLAAFLAAEAGGSFLPWAAELEAAARFGLDSRSVEAAALAAGILPARYARNAGLFGLAGQRAFHEARIVVAGCGGLGGYVVEYLARLGVGTIVALDPDLFDETNLNRQLLATIADLGRPKVEAAARRVAAINPAIRLIPVRDRLTAANAPLLLAGALAVADGLDSIPSRLEIAEAASKLGLAFVHAGVAGWYGQAATQAPGTSSLAVIYDGAPAERGAETALGNQAFAPALAAALEVAELCKLILGLPLGLADRLLAFDLLAMEGSRLSLG
jgi:molybdopterin/thiamine biosynthesis adenylyltransferase